MDIRNNLLREICNQYAADLGKVYGENEAEAMISILVEHLFGIRKIDLSMKPNIRLSESEILRFHSAFKKLKQNMPVQYITGIADFMDFQFIVNRNVLIPRQETEELVDLVRRTGKADGLKVLDIGTGSGCIAISLFHYLKKPEIHAIDVDEKALEIARTNSLKNDSNIEFHKIDILNFNMQLCEYKFDIIISNPPYVTESDKNQMKANVLDFEPSKALFVPDNDPLIFYNRILDFAEVNLKNSGRLYFEINESLGNEVKNLIMDYGYEETIIHCDLSNKSRMVSARKPN